MNTPDFVKRSIKRVTIERIVQQLERENTINPSSILRGILSILKRADVSMDEITTCESAIESYSLSIDNERIFSILENLIDLGTELA